ncbi:MAG: hypothetical protein IT317_17900 [Anaerolineales bacterium]|nr:hypothetical protein [Anaerolineales bacterium]
MSDDQTFGNLLDLDQRLLRHRANLVGVKHLDRLDPADPRPGAPIDIFLTTSGPTPFDLAQAWYQTEPDGSAATLPLYRDGAAWDTVEWGYVQRWRGVLPPQPAGGLLRYQVAAHVTGSGAPGRWIYADNQAATAPAATEFAIWVDAGGVPEWARAAVVYHVFLDRFNPGAGRAWLKPDNLSGFFGGTLRGVIEKLDYLRDLGCDTLWLSPLFQTPSHHGYDAVDVYTVEPRLGTNAELHELIASAHTRGLRVLLDFVCNHWSSRHASFQAALADEHSPYHDWYTWKHWPDDYETYFGVRELPQLNLRRGPARDYLLEAARYWLRQGVDGYRLDYAQGPSHDFWTDFYRACRQVKPDAWLFGEIINTAQIQASYAGRLDGALDFLLNRALRETFAFRKWDLEQFEACLSAHEAFFPPPAGFSRPSFIDNHDMNRIRFAAGGDLARVRLAALAMFSLAGPPILYYGTETGLSQERPIHQNDFGIFEEARLPMNWETTDPGETALRAYFRRLIALRRAAPVVLDGTRRVLRLDAAQGVYAYARESEAGWLIAAFNVSAEPRALRVTPPAGRPAAAPPADLLNGHPVRLSGATLEINLPAGEGAWVAAPGPSAAAV